MVAALWQKVLARLFPGTVRPILAWFWPRFLKPHRWALWGSVACMAAAALMTAASAKLVQDVCDGIFVQKSVGRLWTLVIVVVGIFFVKGVTAYGHSFLLTSIGQKVSASLQRFLFDHIIKADSALFLRYSSGRLLSMMTYDTQVVFRGLTQTLVSIVRDALTLIFLVSLMFYEDWLLACITCLGFPISLLTVLKLGARMRRLSSEAQRAMGALHAFFQEVFQGIRLVKSYTLESLMRQKAHDKTQQFVNFSLKNARTKAFLHPLMEVIGGSAVALVLLYGGYQVILGLRTPGALMSFIAAFLMSYEPLKKLAHLNSYVQEAIAALERLFSLYNTPNRLLEKPDAKPLALKKGDVLFKDLHFSYNEKATLFEGFNCHIKGGQRVAIVGGSGAGKSTLFHLLLRFYDPAKGCVLVDGQDLKDLKLNSLRSQIAFVAQETTLFDDTIANNIRYGNLEASNEDVRRAAKHAYADAFIEELPKGYETSVGEMGRYFSGGQRQRIAIARAFLKNAPVLLLDEATSALDTTSELYVQSALENLMKGRTTMIIAHRLLTAQQADRVFVLEEGRLVQEGTHDQLMQAGGLYKELILPQLQIDGTG